MRKLTSAGIKYPSELKHYIVNETLNPRLINAGGSGLHRTTQKSFLDLINGNQDFVKGETVEFVSGPFLSITNTTIVYQCVSDFAVLLVHQFYLQSHDSTRYNGAMRSCFYLSSLSLREDDLWTRLLQYYLWHRWHVMFLYSLHPSIFLPALLQLPPASASSATA